jgi:hypothetical protein
MEVKQGATRYVLLTKWYAIKIPRLSEWRLCLQGLLANMQETLWWKGMKHEKLCPVLFSIPGGFLIVMPRATPLSRTEYVALDFDDFADQEDFVIPVEDKQDSFGILQGRIVAVDYGT